MGAKTAQLEDGEGSGKTALCARRASAPMRAQPHGRLRKTCTRPSQSASQHGLGTDLTEEVWTLWLLGREGRFSL